MVEKIKSTTKVHLKTMSGGKRGANQIAPFGAVERDVDCRQLALDASVQFAQIAFSTHVPAEYEMRRLLAHLLKTSDENTCKLCWRASVFFFVFFFRLCIFFFVVSHSMRPPQHVCNNSHCISVFQLVPRALSTVCRRRRRRQAATMTTTTTDHRRLVAQQQPTSCLCSTTLASTRTKRKQQLTIGAATRSTRSVWLRWRTQSMCSAQRRMLVRPNARARAAAHANFIW